MKMNDSHSTVSHPVLKVITVWLAAFGITSWGDFAALMAAIYSVLLILEWCWKKFIRTCFENRGWVKRTLKRRSDYE
jgi:hypothetical protein